MSKLTAVPFFVYLELETESISLSYDGRMTDTNIDMIDIDDEILDIFLEVNGINKAHGIYLFER